MDDKKLIFISVEITNKVDVVNSDPSHGPVDYSPIIRKSAKIEYGGKDLGRFIKNVAVRNQLDSVNSLNSAASV